MAENDRMVPNVWICLQKIEAFLDGAYTDKKDVYACIKTMKEMFKHIDIRLEHESIGRRCRNGWVED